MNDMKKLMETLDRINEDPSYGETESLIDEMETFLEETKYKIQDLKGALSSRLGYDNPALGRARYWISSIESALDGESEWMGGPMYTMADTINELRSDANEPDEYMEEDVEDTDYGFDDVEEFMDYLEAKVHQNDDLRLEDRSTTRDGASMDIFNDATEITASVVVVESGDYENDGVQFYMYREGNPLAEHYFEHYDTGVAEQILDLINMPMENTIGMRPY